MKEISRSILCVDDEPLLLEGLQRQLRRRFAITVAGGGEAALQLLQEQGPFAVVVSDYRMPGMNGVEFLRQAHACSPESVLVMLTGEAELNVAVSALHEGRIFRFLSKPCERGALEATLRDCLEQYRLVVSERLLRQQLDAANDALLRMNAGLEELVKRRTAVIEGLHRLVSDFNGFDTLQDVAQAVVSHTADLLESRQVCLWLPSGGGGNLVLRAAVGVGFDPSEPVRIPLGAPLAGLVYGQLHNVVINTPAELEDYGAASEPAAMLRTPIAQIALLTGEGPVGVLSVGEPANGQAYDTERLSTLRAIAESAAIAVLNQVRREERDDARDATILALAKLAEHRDSETGAHLERVQRYCRMLAEALIDHPRYAGVITRGYIRNLERSSPLHDIGKVGIPDHILRKPGKLSAEEFETMKRHTTIGGDTIRELIEQGRRQDFLQMGMAIAYCHHERFDGTGYPAGLAGEAIPLPARILALADVYDALTSRRIYKPPMTHARAAGLIRSERGRHFDPVLVEAFEAYEAQFERYSTALAEADPEPAAALVAGAAGAL